MHKLDFVENRASAFELHKLPAFSRNIHASDFNLNVRVRTAAKCNEFTVFARLILTTLHRSHGRCEGKLQFQVVICAANAHSCATHTSRNEGIWMLRAANLFIRRDLRSIEFFGVSVAKYKVFVLLKNTVNVC